MMWQTQLLLVACSLMMDSVLCWRDVSLPLEHTPYNLYSRPELKAECQQDNQCPYKDVTKCWGYEPNCEPSQHMSKPQCVGDIPYGWANNREEQVGRFWREADFGYVSERMKELTVLCEPQKKDDSLLMCAKYMRYCRAKNIYFDFSQLCATNECRDRYNENVLKAGQVGGHCKLFHDKLKAEGDHKSPLQSWFAELEHYSSLDFQPVKSKKRCKIIIDKPTIIMKLDAGVNMYHHFCDFINLYASQHINGSFRTDINIIMWDTSNMHYGDLFYDTWKAFSDYPFIYLNTYDKKTVCIKDAVFSLLPRMRYGLYYNMPLVPGCGGSSLFRAFSQHVLHRLNVKQLGPLDRKIRITLLSRSTKYRRILNEAELIAAMKAVDEYEVKVVDYTTKYPFTQQLQDTHNSDIFIGMHGAGLTHVLFQPDWSVLFEVFNCGDEHCYKDLARLRGVRYMTWEDSSKVIQEDEGHHPTLGAHQKFTNYSFDVAEFMRLIGIAADYVRNHPMFVEAAHNKYGQHFNVEL